MIFFPLGSTRDNAHRDGMGRRGRGVVCANPDGVDWSERDQKVLKVRVVEYSVLMLSATLPGFFRL